MEVVERKLLRDHNCLWYETAVEDNHPVVIRPPVGVNLLVFECSFWQAAEEAVQLEGVLRLLAYECPRLYQLLFNCNGNDEAVITKFLLRYHSDVRMPSSVRSIIFMEDMISERDVPTLPESLQAAYETADLRDQRSHALVYLGLPASMSTVNMKECIDVFGPKQLHVLGLLGLPTNEPKSEEKAMQLALDSQIPHLIMQDHHFNAETLFAMEEKVYHTETIIFNNTFMRDPYRLLALHDRLAEPEWYRLRAICEYPGGYDPSICLPVWPCQGYFGQHIGQLPAAMLTSDEIEERNQFAFDARQYDFNCFPMRALCYATLAAMRANYRHQLIDSLAQGNVLLMLDKMLYHGIHPFPDRHRRNEEASVLPGLSPLRFLPRKTKADAVFKPVDYVRVRDFAIRFAHLAPP
jgi:hypothetical protein